MTPDNIAQILRSLERMDGKIDDNGEALHAAKLKLAEIEVIAREARAEIRNTNGRVTAIERRESEARGAAIEHRRMEDEADHSQEKWRGILPTVIASTVSGLTVAFVLLLVTGQF
jgi:hypothetical protein